MKIRYIPLLLCVNFSLGLASWGSSREPYTIHYEVKVKSASFGNMGTRKLWVKGGNMRWEYESARLPLCIIKNQQGTFLIHPWNKVVAQYSDGSHRGNPRALLPGPTGPTNVFLANVKAVKHGTAAINGRQCRVYSYTDTVTKRHCKLWVGLRSGEPVQLLVKGERGKADTITATYTEYVEGMKTPDSLFKLPAGYAIRPMPTEKLTSKAIERMKRQKKSG